MLNDKRNAGLIMNDLIQTSLLERMNTPLCDSPSVRAALSRSAPLTDPNPIRFGPREILVLADSADLSESALKWARWFARQFGSKITVLSTIPPDGDQVSPRQLLEKVALSAKIERSQIRSIIVSPGLMDSMQIINAAHAEAADLIIISSDFQMDSGQFWQLDPLDKLIRHAPCPVLVASNNEPNLGLIWPKKT